ncbi:MAG: hypothetical protein MRERV_11c063 [Mycoplasmataceae bacterium RV_VA103A]|nr:MAG: hypothetical protein MRERV_11c063 [Mycoplasmataceae bacterium RV_VA103A]
MNKKPSKTKVAIGQFTNKELLKELAKRIIQQRLEVDNCLNCQAPFELGNGLVSFCLWDNEWEDTSKPDYTGARTNLNYWIVKIRNLKVENNRD